MPFLEITDLRNPDHIKAVMLKSGNIVQAETGQGFQILDKWVELWQKLEDGRLLMVKRWQRYRSVLMMYY